MHDWAQMNCEHYFSERIGVKIMAGEKLRINQESQKIKKRVAVAQINDVYREPVTIHFRPSRVIEVERNNFKQLVRKLTGQGDSDKRQKNKSKEKSATKKAVMDHTKNVSEPPQNISIVTADLPTAAAPNEVCSELPSTLADSLHGPNDICPSHTPGAEPVRAPSSPTPTYDVFQGLTCTDNLFDDLMKTTNDFYPDVVKDLFDDSIHGPSGFSLEEVEAAGTQSLLPLSSPTLTYDVLQGMSCTDNFFDDLMDQTHGFFY